MGKPYDTAAYPTITPKTQMNDFMVSSPSARNITEIRAGVNG